MSNTIESIEQGNKLIGRFMGGKCEYDAPIGWIKNVEGLPLWEAPNDRFHLEQGKYHTSWDWLMPVVMKIKDTDLGDAAYQTNITNIAKEECKIFHLSIWADIETVWQAVVEFIEWYNNQKSNQ